VYMRFNALKNSGELYERVKEYRAAKEHYTQVSRLFK
jgi:hypothetical protein